MFQKGQPLGDVIWVQRRCRFILEVSKVGISRGVRREKEFGESRVTTHQFEMVTFGGVEGEG